VEIIYEDDQGNPLERGTRWPRRKSLKELKDAIRSHTGRSNGHSLSVIAAHLNRTLKGWFEYFKRSHKWTFRTLDGYPYSDLNALCVSVCTGMTDEWSCYEFISYFKKILA